MLVIWMQKKYRVYFHRPMGEGEIIWGPGVEERFNWMETFGEENIWGIQGRRKSFWKGNINWPEREYLVEIIWGPGWMKI